MRLYKFSKNSHFISDLLLAGFKLAWFSKVLYRFNFQFFKIENFAQTPPIITFYCIFKLQFFWMTDFKFQKNNLEFDNEISVKHEKIRAKWQNVKS